MTKVDNKTETGGLSGVPLKPYSLQALQTLRKNLPASIPLIGCGGISYGADALDFARAGASLVQVYTGFGYDGAGACRRIKDELANVLVAQGTTWSAVVSKAVEELSWKKPAPAPVPSKESSTAVDGGDWKDKNIKALIEEGEELMRLLDDLSEKLGVEEAASSS